MNLDGVIDRIPNPGDAFPLAYRRFDTRNTLLFAMKPTHTHAALNVFARRNPVRMHIGFRDMRQPGIIIFFQQRSFLLALCTTRKGGDEFVTLLLRQRSRKQNNAVSATRLPLDQPFKNARHISVTGVDLIG
ncbi:hypothetical protein QDQ58_02870 [Escherichia coli]|nr:hypothetical protein [Escherichia coli]MCF6499482.1 hypothetical protein [Escherichia coli]MCZ6946349.1 hypothetical protein [Escherichia coli]